MREGTVTYPVRNHSIWMGMTENAWLATLTSFLGWTLVNVDASFFTFCYPDIMHDLHLTIQQISYVYTIIYTIGAIAVFCSGPIIDTLGRKWVFQFALVFTAIGSLLSAFCWNFASLLSFRGTTQIGASTEWMAGQVMVAENTPSNARGWWIGFAQIGWPVGWFIASLLAMVVIPALGWRALFMLGILPMLFVLWVRRHVKESMRFQELDKVKKTDTAEMTSEYRVDIAKAKEFTYKQLLHSDLIRISILVFVWQFFMNFGCAGIISWLPSVFLHYHIPMSGLYTASAVATGCAIIGYLSSAYLGEIFGRREISILYLAIGAISGYFLAFKGTDFTSLTLFYTLFYVFGIGSQGAAIAFTLESFPTRVRGTGGSLMTVGACLGFICAGLSGPILFKLSSVSGAVFIWTSIFYIITVLCALGTKRVKPGKQLEEIAS